MSWMLMAMYFQIKRMLREARGGTSLVVHWLRLKLPKQGSQVQSLVGELSSHMSQGVVKNKQKIKRG